MGRPQEINIQEVKRLRSVGNTFSKIAQKLGCSRQAVSNAFKKAEKGEVGVEI